MLPAALLLGAAINTFADAVAADDRRRGLSPLASAALEVALRRAGRIVATGRSSRRRLFR